MSILISFGRFRSEGDVVVGVGGPDVVNALVLFSGECSKPELEPHGGLLKEREAGKFLVYGLKDPSHLRGAEDIPSSGEEE